MRRRRCRDGRVYKSSFQCDNRRSTEARGCGVIRVALGAPWFCSFFLGFRRYDSVGEFGPPGVKTHQINESVVGRIDTEIIDS